MSVKTAMMPFMSPICSPFINHINSFTRVIEMLKFDLAFWAQLQCPCKLQHPFSPYHLLIQGTREYVSKLEKSRACVSVRHNSQAAGFKYFSIILTSFTTFLSAFSILTTKRSCGSRQYTRDKKAHIIVVNKSGYHLKRTVSKHQKPIHNSHAARTILSHLKSNQQSDNYVSLFSDCRITDIFNKCH